MYKQREKGVVTLLGVLCLRVRLEHSKCLPGLHKKLLPAHACHGIQFRLKPALSFKTEGIILFYDALNTFLFTIIWVRTYV